MPGLVAPQLVVNSRMIYFGWLPADPGAVAALVPEGLKPAADRQVFMNQYVVDDAGQTSGFGAYSLTYLGPDLSGLDAPDGVTPGRWWTHYFNSSEVVREYAAERGVPATPGRTTIEVTGRRLVATTEADGVPVIRTTARVGRTGEAVNRGQLRYITRVGGGFLSGVYPFVAEPVEPFEVESLEFLEPDHPVHALRPADPLQVTWGFYSPRSSFAYPGGEAPLS
ncbi:acetoacetate decarboxylase family protein [Bailinhaonella thermotolerans]|uniref:acetoacetate decarboxylase family protein n=1 Tax=Bailinhaonella thermotolerans TaxID=1070861 RepID=UPI001F5B5E1F|nr:acetoacetate decarboxylase family protein [Bailinhaonella thermotolerans]